MPGAGRTNEHLYCRMNCEEICQGGGPERGERFMDEIREYLSSQVGAEDDSGATSLVQQRNMSERR